MSSTYPGVMTEPATRPAPPADSSGHADELVQLPDGSRVTGRRLLPGSWLPLPSGRSRLIATQCAQCDELTFPTANVCPRCWGTVTLRVESVAGEGTVYALTTVRVAEPGIEAPYRIGYADFAGGLRICGRFTGPDVAVGDRVRWRAQPGTPCHRLAGLERPSDPG